MALYTPVTTDGGKFQTCTTGRCTLCATTHNVTQEAEVLAPGEHSELGTELRIAYVLGSSGCAQLYLTLIDEELSSLKAYVHILVAMGSIPVPTLRDGLWGFLSPFWDRRLKTANLAITYLLIMVLSSVGSDREIRLRRY